MRLYKIQITHYPPMTVETHPEDDVYFKTHHLADPALREAWEMSGITGKESHYHFFLPSETKLYRSRSSARDKQLIVERWGGKAQILEAEVSEFIPIADANRKREIARLEERLGELMRIDRPVPF